MIRMNRFDFQSLSEPEIKSIKKQGDIIRYLNSPNAFDIETTSFLDDTGAKRACMYLFMFCIDGKTFYGRTWIEFQWCLQELKIKYKLDYYKRMIIYVHNLAYEFQFLMNRVKITNTFARTKRHPISTLIEDGFEFRCSYFLSGLSLAKTAEELQTIDIKKMEGDLDYGELRHQLTPLTDDELYYGEVDVLIVYHFISNEIKKCDGDITKIPLTKTGYVRQYCRNYIKENTNYKRYREHILKEAPVDKDLFILLNKAFAGGYTHANCNYILDIVNEETYGSKVHSIDFTSSYPAQMIRHKYPRGRFIKRNVTSEETFYDFINTYACVFEICLTDIESKSSHHIWSVSKCKYGTKKQYNAVNDNGRIVRSDEIYTYMTDVDFLNFSKFYTFKIKYVTNMWVTTYGYLPKQLIECILKFYGDKTTLKGVADKAEIYLISKGMLNAIYGMSVTNPVNDEILFDEEWFLERPDIETALTKAYNNPNQFLCYQWGVWITAWARYELFRGIEALGNDAIYSDTDSIKFINYEKHKEFINNYNIEVENGLKRTLNYYDIPLEKLYPKDIKGKTHLLGVWDYEGCYDSFKTLGAKRYMSETNGKLKMTISGLSNVYMYEDDYKIKCEKDGIPYSHENWYKKYYHTPMQYIINNGGLKFFEEGMSIPKEFSKRLTHTYSKKGDHYSCILVDYTGKPAKVEEYYYIHLEPSEFTMTFAGEFIEFIVGINNGISAETRAKRPEFQINEFNAEIDFFGDITIKE